MAQANKAPVAAGAAMISVRGVSKSYTRGAETIRVLDGLDLEMAAGGFYALMGPSGSGKTTLLNLIGGLDRPDAGELVVAGENLAELERAELSRWRADTVGFVFQGFNLIPVLSALENVELPLMLAPLCAQRAARARAERARLVGLEDRAKHRPRSSPAARSSASRSRARSPPIRC